MDVHCIAWIAGLDGCPVDGVDGWVRRMPNGWPGRLGEMDVHWTAWMARLDGCQLDSLDDWVRWITTG